MSGKEEKFWKKNFDLIIATIYPIVVIGATFVKDAIKGDELAITIGLIAIATFLAVFIQLRVIANANEKRIQELAASFTESLDGAKLRVFDNPKYALEYFTSQVPKMKRVRNTSVCAMDQINDVKNEYMNQPWYESYITSVLEPLKKNQLHYLDILTPGILAIQEHRYYLLKDKVSALAYEPRKFDSSYKFTEFTIMEFDDDRPKQVLFGWDHAVPKGSLVFLTDQKDLIGYFENLFRYLWNQSSVIEQ